MLLEHKQRGRSRLPTEQGIRCGASFWDPKILARAKGKCWTALPGALEPGLCIQICNCLGTYLSFPFPATPDTSQSRCPSHFADVDAEAPVGTLTCFLCTYCVPLWRPHPETSPRPHSRALAKSIFQRPRFRSGDCLYMPQHGDIQRLLPPSAAFLGPQV